MKQEIKGDGNTQIKNLYELHTATEKEDFGILDEIVDYVATVAKSQDTPKSKAEDLLETKKKIELNFRDHKDADEVKTYFTLAYTKLHHVESKFSSLDSEDQNDIHAYLLSKYRELKATGIKNIEILRELFNIVLPSTKRQNPKYLNSAHAFVLLFFDDCTIFEKTDKEKKSQTSLFEQL